MSRPSETFEFGDVKITCRPLPYVKAEDIVADVASVVSAVIQSIGASGVVTQLAGLKATEDVVKLLPILAPVMSTISGQLGDGKLKRLAPLVMAGTTVMMPDETGAATKYELIKQADRATVFDAHPELYFAALFLAGKTTFGSFFSVSDLLSGRKSEP